MSPEGLQKAVDLTTIATWIMIIGVAVLLYTSRDTKSRSSRRHAKK